MQPAQPEEIATVQVSASNRNAVKKFIVGSKDTLKTFYERATVALMEKEHQAGCQHPATATTPEGVVWCTQCRAQLINFQPNQPNTDEIK